MRCESPPIQVRDRCGFPRPSQIITPRFPSRASYNGNAIFGGQLSGRGKPPDQMPLPLGPMDPMAITPVITAPDKNHLYVALIPLQWVQCSVPVARSASCYVRGDMGSEPSTHRRSSAVCAAAAPGFGLPREAQAFSVWNPRWQKALPRGIGPVCIHIRCRIMSPSSCCDENLNEEILCPIRS